MLQESVAASDREAGTVNDDRTEDSSESSIQVTANDDRTEGDETPAVPVLAESGVNV